MSIERTVDLQGPVVLSGLIDCVAMLLAIFAFLSLKAQMSFNRKEVRILPRIFPSNSSLSPPSHLPLPLSSYTLDGISVENRRSCPSQAADEKELIAFGCLILGFLFPLMELALVSSGAIYRCAKLRHVFMVD